MPILNAGAVDFLYVSDMGTLVDTELPHCYGNLAQAASYFSTKLHGQAWALADGNRRMAAMYEASTIIDQQSYKLTPVAELGYPKFPMGEQTEVPQQVRFACYEIAIKLLRGFDIDRQIASLSLTAQGFASAKTQRDVTRIPEYLLNGVPSAVAWNYLVPYLSNQRELPLS